MHEVLRAKAQGLVVSGHQETVRIFVEAMKKEIREASTVGRNEFETVRLSIRRDAFIEALDDLIDRIEGAASQARIG